MASRFLKKEEGSASLERSIIFPLIFFILFSLIALVFFFFNRANILMVGEYILRKSAYSWYDDKSLQEDILKDYLNRSKLEGMKGFFKEELTPSLTGSLRSDFNLRNLLLYKPIDFEGSFKGFRNFYIKESFPFYRGSIFLRNYSYTKELLEDALAYLEKDDEEEEGEGSQVVYIIDDNTEEQEYDRVQHIYEDCFYLKKGYVKKSARQKGEEKDSDIAEFAWPEKQVWTNY